MRDDYAWFGPWFKATRKAKKITQRSISAQTGICRSTIRRAETHVTGSFKLMTTLAKAIGYNLVPLEIEDDKQI